MMSRAEAERLSRLATTLWQAADDPDRIRSLAEVLSEIASDALDVAETATAAAIARCGTRAPQ